MIKKILLAIILFTSIAFAQSVTITERVSDPKVYDITFNNDYGCEIISVDFTLDGEVKYSFSHESDKVFSQPPAGTYAVVIYYTDEEGLKVTTQIWTVE